MQDVIVTKKLSVVCTRPRKSIPVEIGRGTTASEVLIQAGLDVNDYLLLNPSTQAEFKLTEAVWEFVPETDGKLHAIPDSEHGNGR